MIEAYYNWTHSIGLHLYTIPTIIAGAAMAISCGLHTHKQNQRERDFNKELNGETEEEA